MKTEKLYDLDSYVTDFECQVLETYQNDDKLIVVTDKTAFFPEGGGQSSDVGVLGGLEVCDVQIENGKILHIVDNFEENADKIAVGDCITGKVDMQKRFSDMQQHSGEHIFSGIVHSLFGYDNVGFHLGKEAVTLDFNGLFTKEEICKVEKLVNRAVWDNKEIRVFYPTPEELETIEYRSKKEINEALRLVEIPGVDMCACCAPHVKMTGEIGMVEVLSFEKFRGGTRVSILCGERALDDIRKKLDENHKVSNLLSAKETETFDMVSKIKNDNAQLSFELSKAKLDLLKVKAESIKEEKRIVVFSSLSDTNMLREYANILSKKAQDFAAVFGGEKDHYKYVIITAGDFDINALCKELNSRFSGRGGGRDGIVQGSLCGKKEEIENTLISF
ncbi:MAG: DHHA1 domain-containing protein [Acutalibacteraceae bacterium]